MMTVHVLFDQLLAEAAAAPRLRAHRNFHADFSDPVQRTCAALKLGTYVRPHCHPQPDKRELLVVLHGTLTVLVFDHSGRVTERADLSSRGGCTSVELPAQTWHTVFPLHGDAVILDLKQGPYDPSAPVCFAPWAPEEGADDVPLFLRWAETAVCGAAWHGNPPPDGRNGSVGREPPLRATPLSRGDVALPRTDRSANGPCHTR